MADDQVSPPSPQPSWDAVQLQSLEGLEWIVHARNAIQVLLLTLHSLHDPHSSTDADPADATAIAWSRRWQLALGVGFSLWRAVFLVNPKATERPIFTTADVGDRFLLRVIRTNTITFSDDREDSAWTAGYYMNNVRFRMGELRRQRFDPFDQSTSLRTAWNDFFTLLAEDIAHRLPERVGQE